MKFNGDGTIDSSGKILRIIPVILMGGGYRVELPATYYQVSNELVGAREGETLIAAYTQYADTQIMVGYGPMASRLTFTVQVIDNMEDLGPYTMKWVNGAPVFHKIGGHQVDEDA